MTRPPSRVDPVRLKILIDRARHEVESGALPSCQIAVARNGQLLANQTFGDATDKTRYILQSAGRAIVASALWKLMSDGALRLDELVCDIVPEFATN
jgi:CubicO group peptidase (beta-lactamase class C family)